MNNNELVHFLNSEKPCKYDEEINRLLKINQRPENYD